MKITPLLLAFLITAACSKAQNMAVNTDGSPADSSAILDVKSTDHGLLIPRMTAAQRNAIVNPATGLMVYQTDSLGGFYYKNATSWVPVNDSLHNLWASANNAIFPANSNSYVGIGTQSPVTPLHVASNGGVNMTLENTNPLATGLTTAMYFRSTDQYYGGIKAIATGSNTGRLGFFTYAEPDSSQLYERLTITDPGNVGINTTTPNATLEVNGTAQVDGDATLTGNLNANSATVTGGISANVVSINGLPAVSSFSSGTQMQWVSTASVPSTTVPAGGLVTLGNFTISPGTFSAAPTIYIGDIISSSESGGFYKVLLFFDNVTATGATMKCSNPTNASVTFAGIWNILVIGPR